MKFVCLFENANMHRPGSEMIIFLFPQQKGTMLRSEEQQRKKNKKTIDSTMRKMQLACKIINGNIHPQTIILTKKLS